MSENQSEENFSAVVEHADSEAKGSLTAGDESTEEHIVKALENDRLPKESEELETSEKVAKVVARVIAREFSGPIPSPDIMANYEDIMPGMADRIIRMAETQSQHRMAMEVIQVKAESRDSLLGVICAFLLGTGSFAACVAMVVCVPSAAGAICGSVLGVTGISAIVSAFLKNTRRRSNESKEEKE